jgi:hypothetical protein
LEAMRACNPQTARHWIVSHSFPCCRCSS